MKQQAVSQNKLTNKIIHSSLKHLARIIGRNNIDMEIKDLARECGIAMSKFTQCFETKEKFLRLTVDRMTELFTQKVTAKVETYPFSDKNRVFYFLRCVEDYLQAHPEAGNLFTMTFFGDIAVSDMYHSLERHYSVWEKTLCDCLSEVTSMELAKRLTNIYCISLKGQLQLADYEIIPRNSYHAENFLKEALYSIT